MVLDNHYPGCSSSPDVGELIKALAKAQAAYKPIAKSEKFDMGDRSYRYSTWKDICEALYPPLLANGLVFIPRQSVCATGWIMIGTLHHADSGQWISSTAPIRDVIDGYGQRSDPQSYEIACTYAKKNLLQTLAGGWAVGDEAPEQEQVVPQQDDQQAAAFEAVRARVEAGLEQFLANPKKTKSLFKRMDELVESGELRAEDCESLKKKYSPKEEEVAVAN
jgi:hypothetical protein